MKLAILVSRLSTADWLAVSGSPVHIPAPRRVHSEEAQLEREL
jgi:hypothetical protein